jgi:hypothetical protein
MTHRSKGRGWTKCTPWSSKLKAENGTSDKAPEKLTVTKPPEIGNTRQAKAQNCSGSKDVLMDLPLWEVKDVTWSVLAPGTASSRTSAGSEQIFGCFLQNVPINLLN